MVNIEDLNKLRFATDPGKTSQPDEGKKNVGFVTREAPSPQEMNWSLNRIFSRFKSLQGTENYHIIGSQIQKDQFTADLLLNELEDAGLIAGDRIAFLYGTHVLTDDKTISTNYLEFIRQSGRTYIDMNGKVLTLSGGGLSGTFSLVNPAPGCLVISGNVMERLEIRVAAGPEVVDFIGSGTIIFNGKIISKELITLELSNQPDHVVLTPSEQNLYSNDDRFVRYDQSTKTFKRRDDTVVSIDDGDWIVINSLEALTSNDLVFAADRLKIESYKNFRLNLGDQGDNIPYAVVVGGNNCDVSLHMTQSMRELATLLGDDKTTPMSNGLTAMENRRVIKNQGEYNRIVYNREQVFSAGAPRAAFDFVRPNHPYLLEWDGDFYEGLLRYPSFDNRKKCFFADLYYWLDRRFNPQLPNPDFTLAYHTVNVPPRSNNFMRPIDTEDPDRHSRTANLSEFDYFIPSSEYTQVSDKIILGGLIDAAFNIRNVKNGQRVQAVGLPTPLSNTTIVRPGSIIITPGSESFLLMDAENRNPVTLSASGTLTLNFSGMAAGSHQDDTFQNIAGSFQVSRFGNSSPFIGDALGVFNIVGTGGNTHGAVNSTANLSRSFVNFDASTFPGARTTAADETRAINSLIIPYYRL